MSEKGKGKGKAACMCMVKGEAGKKANLCVGGDCNSEMRQCVQSLNHVTSTGGSILPAKT